MQALTSDAGEDVARLVPNAATLVATYPGRYGVTVILIRRPDTMRRHPGQIAFPGGMIEPEDPSAFETAVREAREEVGLVVPPGCNGEALAPVSTLSSDIVIQPFWVRLPRSPRLRPNPDEVALILRVPLAHLRRPQARMRLPHPRRPGVEVPALNWRGQVIWGATLRSLEELLANVFEADPASTGR